MLIQIVPQRVPDSYVRSTVTLRTEDRLESLTQLVTSRTQLGQMIETLGLYPEERKRLPLQDVVEKMQLDVALDLVRPRRNEPAEAFHVRFTYTDPVVAAKVTERLGALFVDHNARDRGALADGTNAFLEAQLAEARTRLEVEERKLEEFRNLHKGRLPSQLNFNLQAIQTTQLQLQALVESLARDRDRKLMLERLYNDAKSEPPPVTVTGPVPSAREPAAAEAALPLPQQLETAKANLGRLELRLTPEHPDVVRARRAVADLQAKVAALPPPSDTQPVPGASPSLTVAEASRRDRLRQMAAEIESLSRQITFKEASEQKLRDTIADYQTRIEAVPGLESTWAVLTRDYDTLQASYKDLLTKSEQSKVAADLERRHIGEQFRVLDAPRVPARPISPIRLYYSAGGLVLGLVLGLGLTILLELKDSTFRTATDVTGVLSLPVLAVVPYLETESDRKRLRRGRLAIAACAVAATIGSSYMFWALRLWRYVI
jgi:polysaccharide chain length determinant protein (PEP-CTERM system associated)